MVFDAADAGNQVPPTKNVSLSRLMSTCSVLSLLARDGRVRRCGGGILGRRLQYPGGDEAVDLVGFHA